MSHESEAKRLWRDRRAQAVTLFAGGLTQAEVAKSLGISRVTANQWSQIYRRSGARGLVELRRYMGRPAEKTFDTTRPIGPRPTKTQRRKK